MAYELVYTSAPEGLTRGSSGFCVVACTRGLGPRLVGTLEGLSAYKPLYPHYAPNAWENPVSRSHYIYEANGERQHILSRICFNGVDHTGRSNKLASHLVLSEREAAVAQGGPSSLLLREDLFKDAAWPIKAEYFAKQKEIPSTSVQIRKCSLWESVMGDAGWAGYLAQTYLDTPNKNVYLAYNPEQNKDILPLLHEAMSLLPDDLRWKLTFNTYFVNLPAGMSCTWRCCPAGSDALRASRRSPMNMVIDITKPLPLDREGELVARARTGIVERPEKQTGRAVSPEPEVISLVNADPPGKTVYLHAPRMENVSDHVGRLHIVPDDPDENDDRGPVFSAGTRLFFTIFAIIVLLAATIGGVFYFVSVTKENQVFAEKSRTYKELCESYDGAKIYWDEVKKEASEAKTEKQIEDVIKKITEFADQLDIIKNAAEQLVPHRKLFEKNEKNLQPGEIAHAPGEIIKSCGKMKDELGNELSALEKLRRKVRRKPSEKKSPAKRSPAPTPTPTPTPAPASIPAPTPAGPGKNISGKASAGQKKKSEAGSVKQLTEDDPRYLWTKSEPFHTMGKDQSIRVQLGVRDPGKITVLLLPYMKKQQVGGNFTCEPDSDARSADIETKFDPDQGVLSFILKNQFPPSRETEILIELEGRKTLPLYFKLGVSKIMSVTKHPDNLKIEIEKSVRIRIKSSSMRLPDPERFYMEDNSCCKSEAAPRLCLRCPGYKMLKLEKRNDAYVFEDGDSVLRGLRSRVEALAHIEKQLRKDPMKFAQMVPDRLKKEIAKYSKLSSAVNDEKKLMKIEKLVNPKAKEVPAVKDLREKVDRIPDRNPLAAKWIEQYDGLQKVSEDMVGKLLTEIPLKALGYTPYTDTFLAEKTKAEKSLQDRKRTIENAVRTSTVTLLYGDREYAQFPLKDILQ